MRNLQRLSLARLLPITAGLLTLLLHALPSGLQGQVVNPADAQHPPGEKEKEAAQPTQQARPVEHLRSWELPPVTVVGEPAAELREEDHVGTYGQPRWTATRRFPGTRVYVVPEGKVEFEYWLRPTLEKHGPAEVRHLWELEFGLPYRFQLDLYYRIDQEGDRSEWLAGEQVELRYALADWGKIPGNPTLYFEWVSLEQRPDKIEPKILFGGEIAPRWHWGLNFVAELELGGVREYEYQVTAGVSYAILDSRFSAGVEAIGMTSDVKGDRGDFAHSEAIFIGPSFQYRPLPQVTANVAPLIGVTDDSPDARFFFNFAYEF